MARGSGRGGRQRVPHGWRRKPLPDVGCSVSQLSGSCLEVMTDSESWTLTHLPLERGKDRVKEKSVPFPHRGVDRSGDWTCNHVHTLLLCHLAQSRSVRELGVTHGGKWASCLASCLGPSFKDQRQDKGKGDRASICC